MKQVLFALLILLTTSFTLQAQVKIGDNLTNVNANSILELESTTKALLLPRLTNTQIQAMPGLLYPGSTERGYDFSFLSYYDRGKQLLDVDEEAVFKKALLGTDITKYYTELDQIRDRTRQEVYYLLEYAVKGDSMQAKT